jgi:TRAP-type C4-dicarboxylate transport system permease small subunit
MPVAESHGGRLLAAFEKATEAWALLGGLVLSGVILVVAYSMAAGTLLGAPVPGDFEIVEVGVAVSVFMFLPYCQTSGANVTADIFTAGAGPRVTAALSVLASLVALGFACLLAWRMSLGLVDLRRYEEVTMIYQFPLWIAYVPIVASLGLLVVASVVTLARAVRGETSPPADLPPAH